VVVVEEVEEMEDDDANSMKGDGKEGDSKGSSVVAVVVA